MYLCVIVGLYCVGDVYVVCGYCECSLFVCVCGMSYVCVVCGSCVVCVWR